MELAYLYLNIKESEYSLLNGEYNFSNKYVFKHMEKDGSDEISIEKNKNFIENFYGNNITGLTSIIGKNGTGKTRLLKTIKDEIIGNELILSDTLLSCGVNTEKEENKKIILAIIKNNNIIIYYDHHKIKNIKLNTNLKNVYKKSYRDKLPNYLNIYLKELEDYPCIYYSNVMDFNHENLEERDNIYNISTNYLIHKFQNYYKFKTQQILDLYKFFNSEYSNKYINILRKNSIERDENSEELNSNNIKISFKFNFNKNKVNDGIEKIIKKLMVEYDKMSNIVNRAGGSLTKLDDNVAKKERIKEFSPNSSIEMYFEKLNRMTEVVFILYNIYLYFDYIEKTELPKIQEEEYEIINYFTNDLYKNYDNLNIDLLKMISSETNELSTILEEMKEEYNRIKENNKISELQKQELSKLIDAFTTHLYDGADIIIVYEALNRLKDKINISYKLKQEIKKYKEKLIRIFIEKTDVLCKVVYIKEIKEEMRIFEEQWINFLNDLNKIDSSLIKELTDKCDLNIQPPKNLSIFSIIHKMYNYGSKTLYNGRNSINIDFHKGTDNEAVEYFFSVIRQNKYFSKIIQVDWRNFSSGEISMLNLFAKFYNIKKEKRFKSIKNRSILILIDEVDLNFHPEWQRCIIKHLTDFLSDLFKENKLQIILTSHSPFVISDIPKDNIIFLKKASEQCSVGDNNYFKQTFGANIHTLLNNSFFMENTIGEFANEKIKSVAKDLSGNVNKISEGRKREIIYIIENIGEPIIKKKLQDIYNKKFESIHTTNKIQELSNKIKELEKIIEDNGLK
ncbi:AAA family ATPase [Clostridium botulinum]|uniref:AAA family ATPase n=1 Tax=Clostridium botulinum TaxID=1491 RepID=UPI001E3E69C3|nr:AAA family ATPase [Clostridium botulinum]MCD3276630.1 AAA family ATPase [Clostridium botulinum C/D]MCD3288216.1 AAA family ATPase [Clostridium botulinum C/D]MCD3291289.1 AAA family ATPase [Clostridium botulinum C/D]MCD3301773.1 AAA family ATPase [Clostridium botulinum C/D]